MTMALAETARATGAPLVVSVEDLHVRFDTPDATVHAVNGVSFALEAGSVLGILGESGSGKTVTLRALIGLLPRHRCRVEGRVIVAGHEITNLGEAELRDVRGTKIAMIFQEPMVALDPVFTIGEQIAETIVRHEGAAHADAWRRARDLLEMVQIPSAARRLKSYPHELSGGMRQRAMIALALSCRPSVLLADEPTTALDVTVQIQIIVLLRQLQQELGMAVVFVTHDVGVAVEVADRLAVMYAGRFRLVGEEHRRPAGQRQRDHRALPHAARPEPAARRMQFRAALPVCRRWLPRLPTAGIRARTGPQHPMPPACCRRDRTVATRPRRARPRMRQNHCRPRLNRPTGFVTVTRSDRDRRSPLGPHAAASACYHRAAASALKSRRVDRETRWR